MNEILERWNGRRADAAAEEVLPCCGSRAWALQMVRRRPLWDEAEVLAASAAAWWSLDEADWNEAFGTHPRLGQRHVADPVSERSLEWSSQEQSTLLRDEATTARLLWEGNQAYEAKFGQTFLLCANGRSGAEILQTLEQRMKNDAATEMAEAAEQQRQITALRLKRWMGGR